ncbi:MAG: HIT domain-containing protein [Caldilineae bacterium]|nr:MAG: HIT domain-containing protein [Caldilineae bacterium]
MDRLYTPWRLPYIVNPKPSNCPFCDYLHQDPARDPDNLLLLRGRHAFVVLNRFPYNNGHLMVLPNQHVAYLTDLDDATQAEIMKLTTYCTDLLGRAFRAHGFNVGINLGKAAGAGMEPHLHVHIVPRWEGDTNFMPVIAKTRVLPEWLADTYERLRQAMEEHPYRPS